MKLANLPAAGRWRFNPEEILKYGLMTVLLLLTPALFTANKALAAEMSQTSKGIKAVLKLDPAKGMVDLYLYDLSKELRPVTEAKVYATVTNPAGDRVEKELIGMKMDGAFSFMNTLDMSRKGRYIFDIRFEAGKRTASFKFTHDLK